METVHLLARVARVEVLLVGTLLLLGELVVLRLFTTVRLLPKLRLDKRGHLSQLMLHTGVMAEEGGMQAYLQ